MNFPHNRLYIVIAIILGVLLLSVIPSNQCFAVADPDDIQVYSAKAFENIFETGDMLFVMRYNVEYASEPTEDAEYTFQMQLLNSIDNSLIISRPLNYYQINVHSIYLTAAQ